MCSSHGTRKRVTGLLEASVHTTKLPPPPAEKVVV